MSNTSPTARLDIAGRTMEFDLSAGVSIAIGLDPDGPQPKFFTDQPATAEPLRAGGFSGRVDDGASCNAGWVRFAPHCHGTHTEGPGHLLPGAEPVAAIPRLLPARLVTVAPVAPEESAETAPPGTAGGLIETHHLPLDPAPEALVIRTLPNPEGKRHRDYDADPAYPVLSVEAARAIAAAGVVHLYIDTPSLDPSGDDGALRNHRAYWGFGDSGVSGARQGCTITEMIYVPDDCADGCYLLAPGISPLVGEASPSAPVLFPGR